MIRVIARHLRLGYRLVDIERRGKGYVIDLVFEAISSRRRRLNEVKSSETIREVHLLQAALYHQYVETDEIVVSNGERDEVLRPDFIREVQRRAELTRQLLVCDPENAATRYTAHEDCCYVCENRSCPFLPTQTRSKPQLHARVSPESKRR
jgi:hypothetical protein